MDIKFLCLNGTVFDQETRVCERVDEVDCSKSERFYNLNLELYGNNAVTLSLNGDDEDDLTIDPVEEHQLLRTTSARPSTTSTTSTTTSRPSKPSTTAASGSFQHPAGYPQHYQPQPPFPQVHTSQSKSLYDDKNGGYHHQYIFHNGGERTSNQATSYQLFSNQGAVSSTTIPPAPPPPPPPQIHQIRYSSTVGPPPQIIHSEPSTVTPLFATSSTIQTLLNSNANNPAALINPIFHNHGIASTTEQFSVHSNNPRETIDYRDDGDQEQDIRALEAIQSANKGKISKLTISPVPSQQESSRTVQTKTSQTSQQQQQRISGNFLPTPTIVETTMRSFYPTPRPSPKPPQSSQSVTRQVTQHIHVPQLKPHQITINLPPPDIQRIEGDESFDPFYRDVPKIRKNRQNAMEKIRFLRAKRSLEQPYHFVYGVDNRQNFKMVREDEPRKNEGNAINKENTHVQINLKDFRALKESLIKFRDILFSDNVNEDSFHNNAEENKNNTERVGIDSKAFDTIPIKQVKDNAIKKVDYLEDLKTEASKHFNLNKNADKDEEEEDEKINDYSSPNIKVKAEKPLDEKKHIKDTSELEIHFESTTAHPRKNESQGDVIDLIILDSDNDSKVKATSAKTDASIEIIIKEETKSGTHNDSKTDGKVAHRGQIAESLIKDDPEKRSNSVTGERRQFAVPHETIKQNDGAKDDGERKSGPRRKSSRPRSSKRRISSRIRQQRMENIEPETIQQMERTTTTAIIDAVISTSTTTTTSTSTTTMTPSIAAFEKKIAEQIDSNIFGDSESHTFKELDTRAIGQRDAIYSKSLQNDKSYDASRSKNIERSFNRQIVEDHTKSSELRTDKLEEEKQETEVPDYTQNTEEEDTTITENPSSAKEVKSTEVTHVSEENKSSTEEEDSYKEYEFPDDDEVDTNEGELEENSQNRSSKISSDEVTISNEGNLEKESAYREDVSKKSSTDMSDEEQSSTANYNEEVNSEELNDYQDITESSVESTHSIQEDYREYSESTEGSTMDYTNTEEYTDSQEDITASTEDGEGSTEGVLKFTDELPVSDNNEDEETTEESSASNESGAHDYVDDNYEPENYKTEITTNSKEFEEDKSEDKNDGEKEDTSAKDPNPASTTTASSTTASTAATSTTIESTTSISSSTPITTAITTPRTTTTRRPKTTTPRATPPKLFKPTGNKRIYAYNPPSTTPNPVVIKPRLGLYNPKPAKPIKSYNDLVPKPTIRKLILPTRKSTTTTTTTEATTTTIEMLNTENPEMTTEPVTIATTTTTELSRSEENGLESKLETNERISLFSANNDQTNKEDQLPNPSEQNTSTNSSKNADPEMTTTKIEASTPYPLSKLFTLAPSIEPTTKEVDVKPQETTEDIDTLVPTTIPPTTLLSEKSEYAEITPTEDSDPGASMETAILRSNSRKLVKPRKHPSFNCLEKEMYRFYGDFRDCRLFHYCSPGFTSRQVLDFRFVCEEGTAFDEVTQSCRHEVRNRKCRNRSW
ncbi:hypothetical protein ALC62_03750 [Cyphomyrmex costatus]|uniref:Chitin-binding type-2 domain-containing protein n=1 Tax=Cyphomyrmex costatus TaxID=456900 RepID=A0A151IL34_9HYME|nr:hypothetical protein ALC62_03750 [Cyphomyrmex costatus]